MTLLRNGVWTDYDAWSPADSTNSRDKVTKHLNPFQLLCPEQFQSLNTEEKSRATGVFLNPGDDVKFLRHHLPSLQLIAINFPKYTDGQGYSQARILRAQMKFSGEIRALGDVRPDQMLFMMRAGISSFQFESAPDEKLIQQILARFKTNYQPSYSLPVAG